MAHVLYVEDDVDLVSMNKTILEQRQHDVTIAYSAAEGRVALEKAKPDVAVFDVMMESNSAGFELARHLNARYPEVPIIMLTAIREKMNLNYDFEPDKTWLPIAIFLEKPLDPIKLADAIAELLNTKE